ncbi:MAG TPA: cytochrome b/b6 domain-containing protein [Bauldia sp.]
MSVTSSANLPLVPGGRVLIRRHTLLVRITHWINVVCILFLVMSGLQIFNATPALYLGQKADFAHPVASLTAQNSQQGPIGITQIGGARFNTTGVLGLSTYDGEPAARGFPGWITLPSYQDLATGRRWHFFFAWLFVINGAVYLVASLANRHIWQDLVPTGAELRAIPSSILHHLQLRFAHVREYNVLQKLAYLIIVVAVLPLIVLAGMTMSPGLDSAFPWLVHVFFGRQTARTIHFILATTIVLFVVVHVVMVLVSGVWNNLRSMVTGRYAVEAESEPHVD